uniref:Uncharacterized protein n=1 Tax=Cacopsylla melanoneura TaxID=428564 RepID=A0A8D8ZEP6_9HEMI
MRKRQSMRRITKARRIKRRNRQIRKSIRVWRIRCTSITSSSSSSLPSSLFSSCPLNFYKVTSNLCLSALAMRGRAGRGGGLRIQNLNAISVERNCLTAVIEFVCSVCMSGVFTFSVCMSGVLTFAGKTNQNLSYTAARLF